VSEVAGVVAAPGVTVAEVSGVVAVLDVVEGLVVVELVSVPVLGRLLGVDSW
jgi:hypothetical protein